MNKITQLVFSELTHMIHTSLQTLPLRVNLSVIIDN